MAGLHIFARQTIYNKVCEHCGEVLETQILMAPVCFEHLVSSKFAAKYGISKPDETKNLRGRVIGFKDIQIGSNDLEVAVVLTSINGRNFEFENGVLIDQSGHSYKIEVGDVVDVVVCIYHDEIDNYTTCDECLKNMMVPADKFVPHDKVFDLIVWSHGVNAFNPADNIMEVCERIEFIRSNHDIEISCAHKNQFLGDIGIFVRGDVVCVSNEDLYSFKNKGKRYLKKDVSRFGHIVRHFSEYATDKWSHNEIIVRPQQICGIWAKEDELSNSDIEQLKILAKKLGVKYIKVK